MELERCMIQGRRDRKLTQRDVAEMSGVLLSDVISLESGIFTMLGSKQLQKLAVTVGVDSDMFTLMYRTEFARELKRAREDQSYDDEEQKTPIIEKLPPELPRMILDIMSLPQERRTDLIHTIHMLVDAQMIAACN